MGRMYIAQFENVAITAAQDLFELTMADDRPIAIHEIGVSQHTEVTDAAEEMLRLQLIRGHATSGSGGSTFTPVPLNPLDVASGVTCEINNTTIASTGTAVVLYTVAFNVRVGLEKIWTPETRPIASQASLLVLRLHNAPADSISTGAYIYYEELA